MGRSRTEILEILVIEAYREGSISAGKRVRVADMSTRLEVDAFLKAKGFVSEADFEADRQTPIGSSSQEAKCLMIVVSDTSPVCYLLLIGEIALLPQLYGQVLIPQAVQQELADERSPAIVQEAWISQPSEWLVIQTLIFHLTVI